MQLWLASKLIVAQIKPSVSWQSIDPKMTTTGPKMVQPVAVASGAAPSASGASGVWICQVLGPKLTRGACFFLAWQFLYFFPFGWIFDVFLDSFGWCSVHFVDLFASPIPSKEVCWKGGMSWGWDWWHWLRAVQGNGVLTMLEGWKGALGYGG